MLNVWYWYLMTNIQFRLMTVCSSDQESYKVTSSSPEQEPRNVSSPPLALRSWCRDSSGLGLSCRAPENPGFETNIFAIWDKYILPGTSKSWISHQIIMLLQTSCIARPTNNSSWWWPWWPWWPWCPPWSWLALTACQEILISDRFGLFLNVSWWIYISRALASLTGLEVEPHNNGKENFEVGNLPLDLANSGLITDK